MRIANKLKNLIMKNKRFKQTSILNAEDNQIDTSKDLQNVEQDEVKELTYSHSDGWSLVCYSRNGPSLEELNCSCCTVASCDWRYPVSKLVVELADTITIECSAALWRRTGGGEFEMFPGWRLTPPRRWRVWGFFLGEDYLLTDELWRAWGRSDNSYLDEMMDTVNVLWRMWFQSQLD